MHCKPATVSHYRLMLCNRPAQLHIAHGLHIASVH